MFNNFSPIYYKMVFTTLSKKHKSKSRKSRKQVSRRKINKKTKKQRNIRRKLSKKNKRGGSDKRKFYASDKTLHLICGLAGDFCVLDTALNIKTLYPNTNVRFLTYFTRFVISEDPTKLPQDVENKLNEANIDYTQSDDSDTCLTPETASEIAFGKLDIQQYNHIVLWVIDMQNDFIERTFSGREDEGAFEKGTFAVPGTSDEQGCKLVEDISELIKYIGNRTDTEIVVSRDYHPEGHCSFKKSETDTNGFPPHCVEGTVGAQMNETILKAFKDISEDKYSVIFKGCDLNTDSYGAVIYSDITYLGKRQMPYCKESKPETDKTGGRNNPNMSPKDALIFNGSIDKVFMIPISSKTVIERRQEMEM